MANETFSFSMNWSMGQPSGGDRTRYLAKPFEARPIQDGQALLLAAGEAEPQRIPMQLAQLLSCCDRLRSLDEHAKSAARMLRIPGHQAAGMEPGFNELVRLDLLMPEPDLADRLRTSAGSGPAGRPVETLFVRTCARPATLERLLESLAGQNARSGLKRCIVVDDAREESDREATRQVAASMRARLDLDLQVVDRDRRAQILDHIAAAADADRKALEWFMDGDDADDALTYGAGLNLALLLSAGSRMATMDDDATFDGYAPDGGENQPVFRPQRRDLLLFPAPDETLPFEHTSTLREHPLSVHADFLSASPGQLLARIADGKGEALDELTPNLYHQLTGQPLVKLTCSGVVGDPGTENPQWLFAEPPENLRPLCDDEARYRERVFQRRLFRCPTRGVVTTAFALMTTTLTGVDNRELLLPTASRERNEDMLLGALVAYLYPQTLQATLPHALYHMRPEPRSWTASDLDHQRAPNRGRFIAAWLEELARHTLSHDIDTRVAVLASGLRDLATRDDASLQGAIAREHVDILSGMIARVEETRSALKPPEWLDADFRRVLEANTRRIDDFDQRIEKIASATKRFAERYGSGIEDWCRAWRYCAEAGIERLLEETR